MKAVLFILIVCGVLISRSSARGDQDLLFDEDIKEMTLDDILSLSDNSTDTDTNTSSFDIVDEKSIDEKLDADDPDQGSLQSNYLIVFFCCISAFIVVVLIVGGMVLYIQGKSNEVFAFCCLLPDPPFCFR